MATPLSGTPSTASPELGGFDTIPPDWFLPEERVVALGDVDWDVTMEHGQIRPLDDAKVAERLASLKSTPPTAVLGPDTFLLVPKDPTGVVSHPKGTGSPFSPFS